MLPTIKTIVYATSLGPGAPSVFRYALAQARQHAARIVAVHGIEPLTDFGQSLVEQYISHDSSEEMRSKTREKLKEQINQRMEQLCAQECSIARDCENLVSAIYVREGHPAQVILDVAKECEADLIVMGAHRYTMVGEILGSTTRKVLHNATQPVLVIKLPKGE